MLPRGVVIDSHACGLVGQRWEKRGEKEALRFFLRFPSLGIGLPHVTPEERYQPNLGPHLDPIALTKPRGLSLYCTKKQ
jgi:hypothetical protein